MDKHNKKSFEITDTWFYKDTPAILKLVTVFVWGDALVLIPWIGICGIIALTNQKVGVLLILITFIIRFLGEIVYWLLQQFGPKTYRPYDYGLKKLSNNSIYILYQLTSTCTAAVLILLLLLLV